MKQEITPQKNLEILSRYITGAYEASAKKENGSIQLNLKHMDDTIPCYFMADGAKLAFNFGEIETWDAMLTAKLYDWLDLASGRLNPALGVLSGKLKFKGNTKVFDKLIKNDLLFKISANVDDPPSKLETDFVRNWKRPNKVLVINGSPRGIDGYTLHYLNRFIVGMESGGASVQVVDLGRKKINPCKGCFHCWKNDTGRCVQNDDVNEIYDLYDQSELIVYAFPLYWDTVPGILKNFIERAFCLEYPYMIPGLYKTRHPRRDIGNQSLFVFSVCGFPEKEHFDSVKKYFKDVSHNAHVPFLGGIYRSACMFLPNDPLYFKTYNLVLRSIQQAGKSIIQQGKIDKKTISDAQANVNLDDFRKHSNKFWENVLMQDAFFTTSV